MRKLLAVLGVVCFAQSAPAGDRSWTGLYVGGHGAYLSSDTDYVLPTTPTEALDGALLGLQVGYNWQIGRIVLGAEADISWGNIKDTVRDGNFLAYHGRIDTMSTVRGRLGYSFGDVLPYLTAGWIWAHVEQGVSCADGAAIVAPFSACAFTGPFKVSPKATMQGWVFGGGLEWAIAKQWSLKGEVLFGEFDTENFTATLPVVGNVTAPAGLDLNYLAKVGLNYRF